MESDEMLMARAQNDEVAAFEVLYDRYAGRALRVGRSVCIDIGRAEDAVQEAFLSIWRGRRNYRPGAGSFKAWAMTVVRHRAIDSTRAAASRPELAEIHEEQATETSISPSEEVMASETRASVRESLGRLPEEQSEVIALAFFGEFTHAEIAAQLGLPLGTVKGRMRLGLEKLRGGLTSRGNEVLGGPSQLVNEDSEDE